MNLSLFFSLTTSHIVIAFLSRTQRNLLVWEQLVLWIVDNNIGGVAIANQTKVSNMKFIVLVYSRNFDVLREMAVAMIADYALADILWVYPEW